MIDGYAGDLCDFELSVHASRRPPPAPFWCRRWICAQMKRLVIDGQPYTAPDTVKLSTPTASGCDSVEIYYLRVRETVVTNQTLTFCPGESITLNGVIYQPRNDRHGHRLESGRLRYDQNLQP
jgi:hypothetical protein